MDVEEVIRSALEREADREALPPEVFPAILRRAKFRRVLTSLLVTLTALTVVAGGVAGLRAVSRIPTSPQPGLGSTSTPPPPTSPAAVLVPNLTGLSEGDAVRMLAEVGLLAEIRYQREAPRTGQVLGTDSPPGSEVEAGSSVRVSVAYEPPLPVPDAGEEQMWIEQLAPVARIVEGNPKAFVGLYRDHLDAEGIVVVVFGPGTDQDAWRERLDTAAGELPYRTETCTRSRAELRRIQDELTRRSWSPNAASISFAVFVDPATCTVRLDSDQLTPADIQALSDRFGTAVSLNTTEGASPERLGGGG
jgi:hypothetical protein